MLIPPDQLTTFQQLSHKGVAHRMRHLATHRHAFKKSKHRFLSGVRTLVQQVSGCPRRPATTQHIVHISAAPQRHLNGLMLNNIRMCWSIVRYFQLSYVCHVVLLSGVSGVRPPYRFSPRHPATIQNTVHISIAPESAIWRV